MAHVTTIRNTSHHIQEFEVHGWNQNQNINVPAISESRIETPDGTSGAIIALHEGHEGEQVEMTKHGYLGNDTFDVSNIMGAGGDITVEQVNDASTRKGNPHFMSAANAEWAKTSQADKDKIKRFMTFDSAGHIKRIGPPKENEDLEKWVRRFDEGQSYIGVGAWAGSKGDPGDNAQSSAAHGSKDILITYSDEDAAPAAPHGKEHVATVQTHEHATAVAAHGPGIILTNKSKKACEYFFYDNYWNGNGTAGANFDHPLKSVHLVAGASEFVPLPAAFKGRVQRGNQLPATWGEFQLDASDDHGAHGDISLEQGCDGAAVVKSTDGSNRSNGFTNNVLDGAPVAAVRNKPDGEKALASTAGNWLGGPNQAAIKWLEEKVGQNKAYIVGGTGVPDVASKNQQLAFDFY